MERHPLDFAATPERLAALAAAGHLDDAALARAVAIAEGSPSNAAWRDSLSRVLLFLGGALALSGVIYFFAYNWAALGRFGKFGLLDLAIAGCALGALRVGLEAPLGRALLAAAAVLVGPLLAVFGQTYQTGADPYELFLGWAVLIVPWVAIARFAPLLLVLLLLADTALVLYVVQILDAAESDTLFLLLFGLQGIAWLGFERFGRRAPWLAGRWAPRLLGAASFVCLAIPTCVAIFDSSWFHHFGPLPACLLAPLIGFAIYWYQKRTFDLFMLALALLSAMTVGTLFAGKQLFSGRFNDDTWAVGFFAMGILIVCEVGAAAWWLREVRRARLDVE